MKKTTNYFALKIFAITAFVAIVQPQTVLAAGKNLQWYITQIQSFINDTLIPLFFAIAMLFLFVNIARYFIIDGDDATSREQAKTYILYAVIALVFMTSIWGVISLVTEALDIEGGRVICPDYNPQCQNSSGDVNNGSAY